MTVADGMEAMERIGERPDILLDINMLGIDGLTVCRRIRDKVSRSIVFLTAKVEEHSFSWYFSRKFADFCGLV